MRSLIVKLLFLASILFLAGCGADEEGDDTDGSAVPQDESVGSSGITLFKSGQSLKTGTTETLEVTARVKGESGLLLEEIPVRFRIDDDDGVEYQAGPETETSGGALITNEAGSVKALLSSPGDRTNRTVDLFAEVDGVQSDVLTIPVVGTNISIEGPSTGTVQETINLDFQLRDSQGDSISGETLRFSAESDGTFVPEQAVTDVQGRASVEFTVGQPPSGSVDTLTVEGAGTTAARNLSVTTERLVFTTPSGDAREEVALTNSQLIEVKLTDSGTDVQGAQIKFSTSRGSLTAATDTTDSNGVASTTLQAGTDAGPAIVTAEVQGGAVAQEEILFVATDPDSMDLQVNPGTISPGEESDVVAIVRDANDQLVKNQTINFSITNDTTGSTLSSTTATTDQFGRASTRFIAGEVSGGNEGVDITADIEGEAISTTESITIAGEALFITLGTGNEVMERDTGGTATLYVKSYSVLVTDSSGAPVGGQRLSLEVIPTHYRKGVYSYNGTRWVTVPSTECVSEDIDRDGVLDAGEDTNNDGLLTPGNLATLSEGTVETDDSGFAGFDVVYAQQYANWVDVDLTARGEVSGTESSTTLNFALPMAASDATNEEEDPPGSPSPFGTSGNCGDTD